MDDVARARWAALGAALLFSTGGAAIKAVSWGPLQVAGTRSLLAAGVMVVLLPSARRALDRRLAVVACAYAVMMISFVLGNKWTTAANTIFLQSTAPLYVAVFGPKLLGEGRRPGDAMVVGAMLVGMALVALGSDATTDVATAPMWGNAVSALSGAAWAATLLGLRWLGRDGGQGAGGAVVWGNLLTAAIALPLAWPWAAIGPTDATVALWLGIVQTGMAYVLLTWAVPRLSALETTLLVMAEPVAAPVWAWAVHGEVPSPSGTLGGAVILAALVLRARTARPAD